MNRIHGLLLAGFASLALAANARAESKRPFALSLDLGGRALL
jgi:hypothetical protein